MGDVRITEIREICLNECAHLHGDIQHNGECILSSIPNEHLLCIVGVYESVV